MKKNQLLDRVRESQLIIEQALLEDKNLICSTKFGIDSAIFLHLVTQIEPDIKVVWVDTGYNTRPTQLFSETLTNRLSLNLKTFCPENHTIRVPPALHDSDHFEFVNSVKIEPFQRALKDLKTKVWISSIRRYQTDFRANLASVQRHDENLVKIHPMLDWSAEDIADYRLAHDLPIGPKTYDPTKGEAFRECGLHTLVT